MGAIDEYVTAAREAGLHKTQIERFVRAGYVALRPMLAFHREARLVNTHNGVTELALDGTRGSAKSHAIIAQVCIDDCQEYDELKYLFLRKTAKAAGESFEDLVGRVLRSVKSKANSEKIEFPNGSRVLIGGYNDDGDISKYIGIEYDGIVVEEATQIRGDQMEQLFGSVRTSREDWVPRVYLSTNPGGIGHQFFKERYIMPHRENRETFTRRFFSTYKDNPFINQEYKRYLEGLTGDLAKAWRDGDWDVFAGQAFSQWRHDRHVITQMPAGWERWAKWRAIDWGFAAPWCCLWLTRNPDNGRVYVYREAYATELTDVQQARMILDMTPPSEYITVTYADPAMWGRKTSGDIVTSTADEYMRAGVPLTRADNDRLSGKRKVDRLLGDLPDGMPGLQVLATCANLIRTLPALAYDKIHVEDVDTKQEDHGFDTLKYALTQVATAAERRPDRKEYSSPLVGAKGF